MTGWMMMHHKLIEKYLDELFPDPKCELKYNKEYELLIATVLSAQTTDKRVNEVTKILFDKYDNLEKLNNADIKNISEIIKPIGMVNKKSIFIKEIVKYLINNNGVVPNNLDEITTIPGVGRKTGNVVLSNLYGYPAIAVDTHVKRVSERLNISKKDDDVLKVENKLMEYFPKNKWIRLHHQLVLFGRYYCTASNPKCSNCKLNKICIYNK